MQYTPLLINASLLLLYMHTSFGLLCLGTPIAVYFCIAILNALESLNECEVKVLPMNIQYTKNLSIVLQLSNATPPVCRMSSPSIIALLPYPYV